MLRSSSSSPSAPALVALEERLAADSTGAERDALLARLERTRQRLRRQLDQGLAPDAYRRVAEAHDGCEAALSALPKLWAALQPRG